MLRPQYGNCGWEANVHTGTLEPSTNSPYLLRCFKASVRETFLNLTTLVGSPVPYGKRVGKHFVAKKGVLNSFSALSPMPGQSRGSTPLIAEEMAVGWDMGKGRNDRLSCWISSSSWLSESSFACTQSNSSGIPSEGRVVHCHGWWWCQHSIGCSAGATELLFKMWSRRTWKSAWEMLLLYRRRISRGSWDTRAGSLCKKLSTFWGRLTTCPLYLPCFR